MKRFSPLLRTVVAALLLAFCPRAGSADAQEDFARGVAAFNKGDFSCAFQVWLPLAEQGDAEAQYRLGGLYASGQGVAPDPQKAVEWMTRSADGGFSFALFSLGYFHLKGEQNLEKSPSRALDYFTRAAEKRNGLALLELGKIYSEGVFVPQDKVRAYVHLTLAITASEGLHGPTLHYALDLFEGLLKTMTTPEVEEGLRRLRKLKGYHAELLATPLIIKKFRDFADTEILEEA